MCYDFSVSFFDFTKFEFNFHSNKNVSFLKHPEMVDRILHPMWDTTLLSQLHDDTKPLCNNNIFIPLDA
jgi:hypothetical protein